jgi:hypothetical protein
MRQRAEMAVFAITNSADGRWAVRLGPDRIHGPLRDAGTAGWVRDLYNLDVRATDPRWEEVGGKQLLTHRDCVDHRGASSRCEGRVDYRDSPSGPQRPIPLCRKHAATRRSIRLISADRR